MKSKGPIVLYGNRLYIQSDIGLYLGENIFEELSEERTKIILKILNTTILHYDKDNEIISTFNKARVLKKSNINIYREFILRIKSESIKNKITKCVTVIYPDTIYKEDFVETSQLFLHIFLIHFYMESDSYRDENKHTPYRKKDRRIKGIY